jgi:serine/threonine-protein kinase
MLGSELGSYKLVSLLGAGAMGEVYVGQHALLGRKCAVKVLLEEWSADQDVVARFINEARATSALAHPGIIRVFDFGTTPAGRAYMLMEFLEGQTLAARLEARGQLEVPRALAIGRQLAEALNVAHAQGVVHRDLKPENVFLVPDATAPFGERSKILDFGIAKMLNPTKDTPKTRTGSILGTPVYMSPEQCTGAPGIDHRADVYSLGCVLFHMLCGRPPFDFESVGQLLGAHLYSVPPAPSSLREGLPAGTDEVMARLLAKQPRDRYESMTEVMAAIDRLQGTPVQAGGTPSGQPSAPASTAPVRATPVRATPAPQAIGMDRTVLAEQPANAHATIVSAPPIHEPVEESPAQVSNNTYKTFIPQPERSKMSLGVIMAIAFGLTAIIAVVALVLLRR